MTEAALFPTFVVGSLPRPAWLREVIEDRRDGRMSAADAEKLLDTAVPVAIAMQERAGLDYISDGEWRRESYIKVFAEHVRGFRPGAVPSLANTVSDPAVVEPIEQYEDLTTRAASFLKSRTDRGTIVTLPSPYILGWRMWNAGLSTGAYASREEFMEACVPVLQGEVRSLTKAGVDYIQVDEPWLLMLVDSEHRARIGVTDMEAEIELFVRMVNAVASAASGVKTAMHLCHGHFGRRRYSDGGYAPIMDALADIRVDRLAMEFSAPQSHGIDVLKRFPGDKLLGLGVIDHCSTEVESTETIVGRVEAAMRFVPPERITLNPDCGFSPGSQNPMDIDEAYRKLSAMCAAAGVLRERHQPRGS